MAVYGGKRSDRSIVNDAFATREMTGKILKKYEPIANISVNNCAKNGWIKTIIGQDRAFGVLPV